MSTAWHHPIHDPLYGQIALDESLLALMRKPIVQRLRHVRLSNIDSIDMPSIANLSRFEHVLGVAHLSGHVGFRSSLDPFNLLVLGGSALLHDWAITSFGHLVEEALQYVGMSFDHEEKLKAVLAQQNNEEVGGADLQILMGRGTGLTAWATREAGSDGDRLLQEIMNHIRGEGKMGRVIAGSIDLDNVDNVFRMAFHLGLPIDKAAPQRIAASMVALTESGEPIFKRSAEADLQIWISVRRQVYEHLMLAERDFAGKIMMLFATVNAYKNGELSAADWSLIDHQYLTKLLNSDVRCVRETVEAWLSGELWTATPLWWMRGERPNYPELLTMSEELTVGLGRQCFAYAIKDKRERRLSISYDDGTSQQYGSTPSRWLLGVGSSSSKPFSHAETKAILDAVVRRFDTSVEATVAEARAREQQPWLF